MPLRFTENRNPTLGWVSLESFDIATDSRVVVHATDEAIEDFGLSAVEQRASDKYDAGQFEVDPPPLIRVRTSDFAPAGQL